MNPADVLISSEYPSVNTAPSLSSPDDTPVSTQPLIRPGAPLELTKENVANVLVHVNRALGIDLGDLDYTQFVVLEDSDEEQHGQEDETYRRRDGKREYSHVQLVCEACGHIIIAVAKAVMQAMIDAEDEAQSGGTAAKSAVPKRKRGGILGFKELAAKAKLSPWHFHRVFRSITDVTPKAYGEACWDYFLRSNGFDSSPGKGGSPQVSFSESQLPTGSPTITLPPASSARTGRVAKSGSRSRSRSRPRHASQTQHQVFSALASAQQPEKKRLGQSQPPPVERSHRRAAQTHSSSRSASFSAQFVPEMEFFDTVAPLDDDRPHNFEPGRRNSVPSLMHQTAFNMDMADPHGISQNIMRPPHPNHMGPPPTNTNPSMSPQQVLTGAPPQQFSNQNVPANGYMYMEPVDIYNNLQFDHGFDSTSMQPQALNNDSGVGSPDGSLTAMKPALDLDSTLAPGPLLVNANDQSTLMPNAHASEMPDMNTLSLQRLHSPLALDQRSAEEELGGWNGQHDTLDLGEENLLDFQENLYPTKEQEDFESTLSYINGTEDPPSFDEFNFTDIGKDTHQRSYTGA